jgi:lipoprotein NlpD
VQAGDTLFKIAWRYGMDYKELAKINSIAAPYTIYPGQKLVFKAPYQRPSQSASVPPKGAVTTTPIKPPVSESATGAVAAAKTPSAPVTEKPLPTFNGRWRWPSEGKVVRSYSGSVHKGIDIGGKRGDPIVAVASGRVVYAGTGIAGYGLLLIVKHDDTYLSAYGHNSSIEVAEGQDVKQGQLIARKGDSGTDSVKLHFEIRKNGKPVDPHSVLGKR